MDWDVIVVGAGAAGLVAAERAASRGRRTLLLEKHRKPGVKILMSGGTRCNLTHDTDTRGIVAAFGPAGRFLHSPLASLGPAELVALVEAEGVPTQVEPGGKIFPQSGRAADVLRAFTARLARSGCVLATGEPLDQLERTAEGYRLVTGQRILSAERVVLTTGGASYPGCGTTGDGYRWVTALGHALVPPRPALVPLCTNALWVRALSGVTVPDVGLSLIDPEAAGRVLDRRRGSLLFTHFGLSGPVALDISRSVTGHARPTALVVECDFLPAQDAASLEVELRHAEAAAGKKSLVSLVPELVPRRLAEALLASAGLDPQKRGAELSKAGRATVVAALKRTAIPVSGTRGFSKAEVTAGGVPLDEIDSRTLASKRMPGLFVAGELLDLDGPIGGYNFQAAFSTGWLAGLSV